MIRLVKKYFEIVPLFKFKDIDLKERLTLIFYVTGFILSVVAIITTTLIGMPFVLNIPNLVVLLLCLFIPFIFPESFPEKAKLFVYFVAFIYLPITYYINGGHSGVGVLYFLMMFVYFAFYFDGKKLLKLTLIMIVFYIIIIILGYIFPSIVIPYDDEFSRLIDLIVSLIAIATILTIIANSVFTSYQIEKDNAYNLMEELAKKNIQLETLSNTDQLTGVYNRRYFLEVLEKELEQYKTSSTHFYFMMIDLDDFKIINDTYGHLYGDEILKNVSRIIQENVREHDIVSRYGGEEFAVIISHASKETGNEVAERIRKNIEKFVYRNNNVTVSIGVAKNIKSDESLDLIHRADNYLYKAKELGKNQVANK